MSDDERRNDVACTVEVRPSQFYIELFAKVRDGTLADRFETDQSRAIDIVVPVINTNPLFHLNLLNWFEQVPIRRLIVGDGGCTDDTIAIARRFPRVSIVDQRGHKSLGFSIKDLVEHVETELFAYLHADVWLPDGWFEEVSFSAERYDWIETPQRLVVLVDFWNNLNVPSERSYSGAQFGRTTSFLGSSAAVEDDYLWRNEDIVFSHLHMAHGYRYHKLTSTFHYHQVMDRAGAVEPKFRHVTIQKESDPAWNAKANVMQYRGIVKYLDPTDSSLVRSVLQSAYEVISRDVETIGEVAQWIASENRNWKPYVNRRSLLLYCLRRDSSRWLEHLKGLASGYARKVLA